MSPSHLFRGEVPTYDDILTVPMKRFFEVEQRNAMVVPETATLHTAKSSFTQAPNDVLTNWFGTPILSDSDRDAFRNELDWLISHWGDGDTTLEDVLTGK
jgi:hypothetical protein